MDPGISKKQAGCHHKDSELKAQSEEIKKGSRADRRTAAVLGVLIGLLLLFIIPLASVPPVSKDALVHHLAVPKLYLEHKGIVEIPSMPFSYYPMNLDLLYMVPLYFGNDVVPKFIHFGFALLTSCLIYGYLKRRLRGVFALLGTIFFLSLPIVVKLSISVYVDLGLMFFSTGALLFMLRWLESGFRSRFLVLSAIFAGLAMGTKYNGLICCFLLALFVPYIRARSAPAEQRGAVKGLGNAALFVAIGLLVFSPWLVRNYLWTDNPFFPLYDRWFNPQSVAGQESLGLFVYRAAVYGESWWEMALLPVRIFFQGRDGSPQYFDGQLNPFLFFLPFLAFYRLRSDPLPLRREKWILLAFTVLFLIVVLFTTAFRIRYAVPVIPPLVILSVLGMRKVIDAFETWGKGAWRTAGPVVLLIVMFLALYMNARYIVDQYRQVDPLSYLAGKVTRDEYIAKYRPEYPAMQYINSRLPPDAVVLFVFIGDRGYYCDRKYVLDMAYNRSLMQEVVGHAGRPEDIFFGLRDKGITHLLMHSRIFSKWAESAFDEGSRELVRCFFQHHAETVFSRSGYVLYTLRSAPPS